MFKPDRNKMYLNAEIASINEHIDLMVKEIKQDILPNMDICGKLYVVYVVDDDTEDIELWEIWDESHQTIYVFKREDFAVMVCNRLNKEIKNDGI